LSNGRILVIAPNPDLRRSLTFALEAEGYEVAAQATLLGPDEGRDFDCVVLDHKAAKAVPRDAVLDFCAHSPDIVLLAGAPQPWLAAKVFEVVQTPHLGEALTAAVRAAIAARRARALAC
jgi:DNA-binding NtrC family response regulator